MKQTCDSLQDVSRELGFAHAVGRLRWAATTSERHLRHLFNGVESVHQRSNASGNAPFSGFRPSSNDGLVHFGRRNTNISRDRNLWINTTIFISILKATHQKKLTNYYHFNFSQRWASTTLRWWWVRRNRIYQRSELNNVNLEIWNVK